MGQESYPDQMEKVEVLEVDNNFEKAMKLCDEIQEIQDENYDSIAFAGRSFFNDIVETMEEIKESVEKYQNATDKQVSALQNMKYGMEKWVR